MLSSELRQVPLHQLRDGSEYPLGNINMRHGGEDADLGPLRVSLRENGQFQNMVGSTYGGGDEVFLIMGNRRRRAAQANQDEDRRLSLNNMDVRVYADLTVEQAMELALAEHLTELPPHEVDQYEAFAALTGKSPKEIAGHYCCSERLVRQRMKLGSLSPRIRDAWREGQIDRATAEAFTMGRDHKAQNKVFDKLLRRSALTPHNVRSELVPDQQDVPRLLHFASAEYQEAGGEIITDLFEDDHAATDTALLRQIADKKLAALAESYVREHGFQWAAVASDLPAEWTGWPVITFTPAKPRQQEAARLAELAQVFANRDATPGEYRAARVEKARIETVLDLNGLSSKKRATSGAVLRLDGDGGVELTIGVQRPADDTPRVLEDQTATSNLIPPSEPERAAKAPPAEAPPTLSHKSQTQRAVELTDAVAAVIAKGDARLATIILLAGFGDRGQYGAVRATLGGSGANALHLFEGDDMAKNIARLSQMKAAALDKMLAQAAAAAIVFQAHSAERPALMDDAVRAIIGLLPAKDLQTQLTRVFDADDYFGKSLPKEFAIEAIRENCGGTIVEAHEDDSANDLRAFALANLKPDWLPPPHRFKGYTGPGARRETVKARTAGKSKAKKKR